MAKTFKESIGAYEYSKFLVNEFFKKIYWKLYQYRIFLQTVSKRKNYTEWKINSITYHALSRRILKYWV